jgi:hypothetical protein
MELAEHVVGARMKMCAEMAPPQYAPRLQVDADIGADDREIVEVQTFVLHNELSLSSYRRIINWMDVVKVVVDGHNDVWPPLGLRIEDDCGSWKRIVD